MTNNPLKDSLSRLLEENGVDQEHLPLFQGIFDGAPSEDLFELCRRDKNAEEVLNALLMASIEIMIEKTTVMDLDLADIFKYKSLWEEFKENWVWFVLSLFLIGLGIIGTILVILDAV